MGRFMLCDYEEAKRFDDPEDWTAFGSDLDFSTYLVDTVAGMVIFCDSMEPEDATLGRALQPLVRYMEELVK
jgi:hypothetical protein